MPTEKPKQKNEPLNTPKIASKKVKPTKRSSKTKAKTQRSEQDNNPIEDIKLNKNGKFVYKTPDGQRFELNLLQLRFCIAYLEFYGNGTTAAIEAGYDIYYKDKQGKSTGRINYNLAHVIASENLRKPNIFTYINLRLDDFGYNDENVKKQHLFLINQHTELTAKAKGLDMWYKIKGDYKEDRNKDRLLDLLRSAQDLPDDELEK